MRFAHALIRPQLNSGVRRLGLLLPSKGPELESPVCQDLQYGSLLESSGPRLRRQSWLGLSD